MLTPRWAGSRTYVQGVAMTPTCMLYDDGAAVTPSSGLFSLYRPDGTAWTAEDGATAVTGGLSYPLLSTDLDAETPGPGWVELWQPTVAGVVYRFRRAAVLGVLDLHPVVVDADLFGLHPELVSLVPDTQTSWGPQIDAAFALVTTRLDATGVQRSRLVGPEVLRSVVLYTALEAIATLLDGGDGRSRWAALAVRYGGLRAEAWREVVAEVDTDDDHAGDSTGDSDVRFDPTMAPTMAPGIGSRSW